METGTFSIREIPDGESFFSRKRAYSNIAIMDI